MTVPTQEEFREYMKKAIEADPREYTAREKRAGCETTKPYRIWVENMCGLSAHDKALFLHDCAAMEEHQAELSEWEKTFVRDVAKRFTEDENYTSPESRQKSLRGYLRTM